MEEEVLLTIAFIVIIMGLVTGFGSTVISGFSYFKRFKKINRKWFIGGITASGICTIIGIVSWVCFVIEYNSPPYGYEFNKYLSYAPGYLSVVGAGVDLYASVLAAGIVEMTKMHL